MSMVYRQEPLVHTRHWSHKNGPDNSPLVLQILQPSVNVAWVPDSSASSEERSLRPAPHERYAAVSWHTKRADSVNICPKRCLFQSASKQSFNSVLTLCCAVPGEASNQLDQCMELCAIQRDIAETLLHKLPCFAGHAKTLASCP